MALFGTSAELVKLAVELNLAGNFTKNLLGASKGLNKFDARLSKSETRAYRFGQQLGIGIRRAAYVAAGAFSFLAGNVALGLNSLVELEKQTAQTNAVIKSTKGAAHVSAGGVSRLAEEFENLNATIGDEVIRSAENLILTFTNITGVAFKPTLAAILDLNTALGRGEGGLQQTVLQVGKAMQDPVKGITALRRAGVSFTAQQIKKIKSLVKEGKLYDAQKLILRELNKEFGGSFLAQGQTTGAKVAKVQDAIEDLQRSLAAGLLPVVSNVADALSTLLADPAVQADIRAFGKDLAGVFSKENIAKGVKTIGDVVNAIKGAIPTIKTGLTTAASVIGGVLDAFAKLPPEVQQLAVGALVANKLTGGIVTNLAGGLISAVLKQLVSGVVNVQGGVVNVAGPGVGGPTAVAGGAAKTGISTLGKLFLVGEAIGLVAAVLAVRDQVASSSTQQAKTISGDLDTFLSQQPDPGALTSALDGVNEGIRALNAQNAQDPIGALLGVQGDALAELQAMRGKLTLALQTTPGSPMLEQRHGEQTAGDVKKAVDSTRTSVELGDANIRTAVETGSSTIGTAVATSGTNTNTKIGSEHASTRSQIASSSSTNAATISGAIARNRPIITVGVHVQATQVTKTVTIQERYGPGNGSYGTEAGK
jgi:hypothetical protein